MIKRWILNWIYKNVDVDNFQKFKDQAAMLAFLDMRVNHLEEKQNE